MIVGKKLERKICSRFISFLVVHFRRYKLRKSVQSKLFIKELYNFVEKVKYLIEPKAFNKNISKISKISKIL